MGSCRASSLNFVTVVVNTVRKYRTKTVELFLWSRKSAAAEGGLRFIPQSLRTDPSYLMEVFSAGSRDSLTSATQAPGEAFRLAWSCSRAT